MAGDELLLSIDCGTRSVRALLFDLRGEPVAKSQPRLDGCTTPKPGWHEHDVDTLWQQVRRSVRHDTPRAQLRARHRQRRVVRTSLSAR